MKNKPPSPAHPGLFIRQRVIPSGMSVKAAAERLGVGRPALSNLLNGNSSLSADMAVRLERAFGADRQVLLDLQGAFDRHDQRGEEKAVAVRAYVPGFLTIKARQISEWAANNLEARQLLPVLLRKLVQSTGLELQQVDMPGYDNAERKGWDGLIKAGSATPWIPEGISCWEFGTNKDPAAKAEKDYAARLSSVPPADRSKCTFVFATPHDWPGKTDWARTKAALGDWKAVKTIDASDLEQWLEESIPAQIWLAEKLGLPTNGFSTLENSWQRWSMASEPPMVPAIFEPSITAYRVKFNEWLQNPSERPFVIAADSRGEALAFLVCLFDDESVGAKSRDLVAFFDSASTLRKLVSSSTTFIPIVDTEETERELASVYRRLHCIIIRPRNSVVSEPDIGLDLLGHEAFVKALGEMGIEGDAADRLAQESGRSPTILRRRLSKIEAIRSPEWARAADVSRSLIPMTLVGAWHAKSKADCEVISLLADREYRRVEEDLARLRQFDDPPVWSAGQYRGVASKIDALFAVNKAVTERDISDFFTIAEYVLSESDPALELPEDDRWAAGMYGKVRDHSAALRQGICETLVILAVHGNGLFRDRLGLDVAFRVSSLVRRLLFPLTLEKLLSHDNDLPKYAEAAPDEFLNILEEDLGTSEPVVLGLLKPASSVFGGCPRTGLLWALECLAWKPENLSRVSSALAQLSRTNIEDNWANKPIRSLEAIYSCWMPQTAASLDQRMRSLEMLAKRFPDIGWQICIDQFATGSRIGHYNNRPRWRSDASGAGQPYKWRKDVDPFVFKALDLALDWPSHDEKTLGDLVERLEVIPEKDRDAVWNLIDGWAAKEESETAKADLRERIRRFAFTRRGHKRDLAQGTRDRAREAYAKLQAKDAVVRHAWLFTNQWVEVSADEIEDEEFDFSKRGERIEELRIGAIKEIWQQQGFAGIEALLSQSGATYAIGQYTAPLMKDARMSADFLRHCLSIEGEIEHKADGVMQGFLGALDAIARAAIISATKDGLNPNNIVRLLRCAPFGSDTWRLLEDYSLDLRESYWRTVYPRWNRHSDAELVEIIDHLLEAKRPRAAFHAVHLDWNEVETSRLKRLLLAIATSSDEPSGHYRLDAHSISEALDSLDGRPGVTVAEMAQLEFLYIEALDHSEHGIPNLERQISESPSLFVQAIAHAYKRSDTGQDPAEWRIEDPERVKAVATGAYRLLDQIRRIPGTEENGEIKTETLLAWTGEVRRLCVEYARADIGDVVIGQLFARAPKGTGEAWPPLSICEVMERTGSQSLARGFRTGTYNSRGMHARGEGGQQERDLAAKYRAWSRNLAFDYPFVAGVLESIAATYDSEAEEHDSEDKVRKRLMH